LLQCERIGGDKDEREQGVGVKHPKAAKRSWHPTINAVMFVAVQDDLAHLLATN
jgi:hypothetical protein